MEYKVEEFKRITGRIYGTSDGHKYFQSKIMEKYIYLRCALFKSARCKATAKLNRESNMIFPLNPHNHNVDEYNSDVHKLKNKCKKVAKHSQSNLRKIFDDTTRSDPSACEVSFTEIESSMYRARRMLQPKIPLTASEFCDMLPGTNFGITSNFRLHVEIKVQ